ERAPGTAERFLQRDLDLGLDILTTRPSAAPASAEEILQVDAAASTARPTRAAAGAAHVTEDRAKEIREVATLRAVFDAESAATGTGAGALSGLCVSLPVRAKSVVALALLGIRQDLVCFGDFLETLAVLALGDVGVMLARQLAVGGLDGLGVGLPVDAENLVVVLELDSRPT